MGHQSRMRKETKIHRQKLFGGKPVEQIHQELAWMGKKCGKCGQPPAIRILVLADPKEFVRREPHFAAMAQHMHGGLPMVQTKWGPMVKYGEAFACSGCRAEAEKTAARGQKDWMHIWIDRGPEPDRPQVQV